MESAEIQEVKSEIVETTPASLIQLAIQQGVDVEKLEKLLALQERWEANKSRKEFFESLADFQFKCPVIKKTKKADFPSSKGGRVTYTFAPLDQIISQIKEALKDSGLSYRWEYAEKEKEIQVTCLITHKSGHTEKTTFSSVSDTSGSKNEIQSDGSTLTYLRRYSLCGALGIASADEDVDGEKKEKNGLHPDMQTAITDCKRESELKTLWDKNADLKKDEDFKEAINFRKKQIIESYQKQIIGALAKYKGEDKELIKEDCAKANKDGKFNESFAYETAKKLNIELI